MHTTLNQLEQVITAIHQTPQMVVIEFAGAGAQALAWLHGIGGSSRTILEATDHYAAASLVDAIGFVPEQFASTQVATAMATKAFLRASGMTDPRTPTAGIGCTATIATDRTKRGEHRCCLAVCTAHGVISCSVTLTKGLRTRREEEHLVSLLIIKAVADVCGVVGLPPLPLTEGEALVEQWESVDLLARLTAGEVEWMVVWPDGHMATGVTWPNLTLLSGAFNPLHRGHRELAQAAAAKLQQEVYFELPLVNAEKAPIIDLAEVRRRVAQFANFAPLILTRVPLFSQKAQFFPKSVFVLGIDTVERLTELRFYDDDPAKMYASFKAVRAAGCRFLVAGRFHHGQYITLRDVDLPQGYQDLFEELSEKLFRVDISSTTIRQGETGDDSASKDHLGHR